MQRRHQAAGAALDRPVVLVGDGPAVGDEDERGCLGFGHALQPTPGGVASFDVDGAPSPVRGTARRGTVSPGLEPARRASRASLGSSISTAVELDQDVAARDRRLRLEALLAGPCRPAGRRRGRAGRVHRLDPGAACRPARSKFVGELRVDVGASRRRGTRSRPRPCSRSWSMERSARSIGTAKPTPALAPDCVWICWLSPITRPRASTSGPPELPGLMAASVWIAPAIRKSGSATPRRGRSPTRCRPSATGARRTASRWRPRAAPTSHVVVCAPSGSGCRSRPSGSILSSATSASGSKPRISASTRLPSAKST